MPSVVKVPTAVICVEESLVTESAGTIAPVEATKSTCTPSLKLVPTIVKVVCAFVDILGEIEVKVGKPKTACTFIDPPNATDVLLIVIAPLPVNAEFGTGVLYLASVTAPSFIFAVVSAESANFPVDTVPSPGVEINPKPL